MANVHGEKKDNRWIVKVAGDVDSTNASIVEKQIFDLIGSDKSLPVTLDFDSLDYISSAGLRVLLRLKKEASDLLIDNVNKDVYDILEMTSFTSILTVKKKLREISIEGCPLIGQGGNGKVYRLTSDEIVKVFRPNVSLDLIQEEHFASREAFLLGVPCAITFDDVRCGDSYGTVYEMINAATLSEEISKNPDKIPELAKKSAELLKKLHSIELEEGRMGDAHHVFYAPLSIIAPLFTEEEIEKMRRIGDLIPHKNRFVHNDYHCKNIMVSNGEFMLIDMGGAGRGNPIIDIIHCYMCYKLIGTGTSNADLEKVSFLGIKYRHQYEFWDAFVLAYYDNDEAKVKQIEKMVEPFALLVYFSTALTSPLLPEYARPIYVNNIREKVLAHYDEIMKTKFED